MFLCTLYFVFISAAAIHPPVWTYFCYLAWSNWPASLQEAAHAHELAEWDAQIRARNDELTRLTNENTQCLTAVAEYTRNQMEMENTLANTQVQCSPVFCMCT